MDPLSSQFQLTFNYAQFSDLVPQNSYYNTNLRNKHV